MSQTIHRMYGTDERAATAAAALEEDGYQDVLLFTRPGLGNLSTEGIVAALMNGNILKAHALVLAHGIQQGGALVTVHAPFGGAVAAAERLDSFGPIDSGVTLAQDRLPGWDEAAPCSSAFGWRVLLDDSDTFSRFWNLPALAKKPTTTCANLGIPELKDSAGPYKPTIPMALLSNKPTFLSSMLGLPVLIGSSSTARRK
jgi:hypothetical protein